MEVLLPEGNKVITQQSAQTKTLTEYEKQEPLTANIGTSMVISKPKKK